MRRKGLVIGVIAIVAALLIAAVAIQVLVPRYLAQRQRKWDIICINNQKQLVTASLMYAQDNNNELPDPGTWHGDLCMDEGVQCCPAQRKGEYCYGYNANLTDPKTEYGKMPLAKIESPETTVLTADCHPELNYAFSTQADIIFRHNGKAVVSYVDGHVGLISPDSRVRLKP